MLEARVQPLVSDHVDKVREPHPYRGTAQRVMDMLHAPYRSTLTRRAGAAKVLEQRVSSMMARRISEALAAQLPGAIAEHAPEPAGLPGHGAHAGTGAHAGVGVEELRAHGEELQALRAELRAVEGRVEACESVGGRAHAEELDVVKLQLSTMTERVGALPPARLS